MTAVSPVEQSGGPEDRGAERIKIEGGGRSIGSGGNLAVCS